MSHAGVRRFVLTGAIAAITATGAIYGAGLKSQQEYKKERKQAAEVSVESRIALLETEKARMITKKNDLEKKIAEIQARRTANAQNRALK